MPSCKVPYTRYCCPRESQMLNLYSTVSQIQKDSSIDVWKSKTGVFSMGRVESLPFLLKSLPEARYWTLTSEGKVTPGFTWFWSSTQIQLNLKKISIVLIWSQIKDIHTDRFQLQFSVTENTVCKSYTGTLEDLKTISKIHDRIWFFWISLEWASPAIEPAFIWSRWSLILLKTGYLQIMIWLLDYT